MHEVFFFFLFCGQTLHFKNCQAALSLLFPAPPFQRHDASFVFPSLSPTRLAKSFPSPDGEHTSVAFRSLRMSGGHGGGPAG